jgi:hypothetical protein
MEDNGFKPVRCYTDLDISEVGAYLPPCKQAQMFEAVKSSGACRAQHAGISNALSLQPTCTNVSLECIAQLNMAANATKTSSILFEPRQDRLLHAMMQQCFVSMPTIELLPSGLAA